MKQVQMHRAVLSAAFVLGMLLPATPVSAEPGAFEGFAGDWSGEGTIRLTDGAKERLKCKVIYIAPNAAADALNLDFACKSDNYTFNLTGNVDADAEGTITGQWKEASRNFGGTVNGKAQGERIRVHIASSGFSASLFLTTRDGRQTVAIESGGGGEEASAAITLRRKK
jgi:hypothetical protein